MLASLLPGLRELRAPLAAGYIWLLGVWLSVRAIWESTNYTATVYRNIIDLANWAGRPALFAASAFAAYLVGVMSNSTIAFLDKVARRTFKRRRTRAPRSGIDDTLRDAIISKLSKRFLDDTSFQGDVRHHVFHLQEEDTRKALARDVAKLWDRDARREWEERNLPKVLGIQTTYLLEQRARDDDLMRWNLLRAIVDTNQLVESVRRDLEYMAPRLIGKEDTIYGEYDRLVTEGNFRVSMFLPLSYLFGILSWFASPWWLFGFIAPAVLLYLGAQSRSAATQHLALAMAAERIESPALERLASIDIPFASYVDVVASRKRLNVPTF